MKYKYIVFDIDGTLLDTEVAVLSALQDTIYEVQKKKIDFDKLKFALGIPGENTLKKMGITNVKEVNLKWNKNMCKYADTIKVFTGINEVLNTLKQKNMKLGIITSKNKNEYINDFKPLGLDCYFETIICAEDTKEAKPSPAPMLEYLKREKAKTEEVIYIGDTIYDFHCAQNAKVDFGLAMWGCHSIRDIQAQYYFDTPANILDSVLNS